MLAADIVNDNGISAIALAAFAILIPGMVTIIAALIQQRGKLQELREIAKLSEKNTQPVSNGFAKSVNDKLDRLENMLADHIDWHLHHQKEDK